MLKKLLADGLVVLFVLVVFWYCCGRFMREIDSVDISGISVEAP